MHHFKPIYWVGAKESLFRIHTVEPSHIIAQLLWFGLWYGSLKYPWISCSQLQYSWQEMFFLNWSSYLDDVLWKANRCVLIILFHTDNSLGCCWGLSKNYQSFLNLLFILPLWSFSSVNIIECFPPNPHVDHDPFHYTSNTEEDRHKSVSPKATFTWHKTQNVLYVSAFLKHVSNSTFTYSVIT